MGLEGLRVLELGDMVAAAYASKMMADLGADVVKIEPPEGDRARRRGPFPPTAKGDPEQSGLFLALNTNKRSVKLDLRASADRARFEELVGRADMLVHSHSLPQLQSLGLSYETLRDLRPELVMLSITPFGLTGPHARYRAEEITVQHGSGWGFLSPGASDFPKQPPLKAFGHQADLQAGIAGAMAGLAAYYRVLRTGQGEHVDLSSQAWVASHLEAAFVYYTYPGVIAHRLGARGLNPWGIYECKDGLIFVATIEEDQWQRLIDFMGRPDWAELELFVGFPNRWRNADALRIFLQEWIGEWKVDDLFHAGQKQRICFAPVLSMEELAREPHLAARGFFVDLEHPKAGKLSYLGAPYRLREPWWKLQRPAPLLGEHDAEIAAEIAGPTPRSARTPRTTSAGGAASAGLPLAGVRVADFSWVWAGPFCAMQLAHLGAEVIKIESDARPDLGRRLAVYPPDTKPGLNRSGYFNQWNQGKKSLRLNLGNPAAIAVVKRLVAECDVVVENFAVGVMERLGLDYETLRLERPDLIMASISGYGETGPYRNYMGYGPAISPISGLSALSGYADGPPSEVGLSLADPCAGVTAAAAVCAALAVRENGGGGQHIDCSLWESVAATLSEGWMEAQQTGREPKRMGNRDPLMAPHGLYPCLPGGLPQDDGDRARSEHDDRWVSIACATDAEWQALAGAIAPQLASDDRFTTALGRKRHEDTLDDVIADYTRTRDPWEVTRALQAVDVAAFPCMSAKDIAEDAHLASRGFHERLDHPEVGRRQHAGIPWRLTNGPNGVRAPAPCLGADTEAVLVDLLGYTRSEVEAMVADGVIA